MNIDAMIAFAEELSESYDAGRFYYHERHSAHGGSRTCYVRGGYAFKAVWNQSEADYYNLTEWDTYHTLPEEVRHLFTHPIYISRNHRVIVMEAVECEDATRDQIDTIRAILEDHLPCAAIDAILYDACSFNFGKRNGQTVMLDYACVTRDFSMNDLEKRLDNRMMFGLLPYSRLRLYDEGDEIIEAHEAKKALAKA